MAKITIPKLEVPSTKGWPFVLVAGVALAVVALVDRGGVGEILPASESGCRVTVDVAQPPLYLREGPGRDSAQTGEVADGTPLEATDVVQNGYRQLADGSWAFAEYLVPEPGGTC